MIDSSKQIHLNTQEETQFIEEWIKLEPQTNEIQEHQFQMVEGDDEFIVIDHQLLGYQEQECKENKLEEFLEEFSNNPKNGIQLLISSGLCEDNNQSIAKFLFQTQGLSKDALNKYFGDPEERNQQIFEEYCSLLDLKGLSFVKSLRLLLQRFNLAGEAQKIDRMLGIFAEVYHKNNPEMFASADIPYQLGYSMIMLSTDVSSSQIPQRQKMTKQQFVRNNRPVFPNFNDQYFEEIYDQIVKDPFKFVS